MQVNVLLVASCFALVMMAGAEWTIASNQSEVVVGMTPVAIECRHASTASKITELIRIRILRVDSDGNEEVSLASIYNNVGLSEVSKEVTAKGDVQEKGVSRSYLIIEWSNATLGTIGQFICRTDGYDAAGEVLRQMSNTITIKEKEILTLESLSKSLKKAKSDIKLELDQLKNQTMTEFSKLHEKIDGIKKESNETDSKLAKEILRVEKQCETGRKNLQKDIANLKNTTQETIFNESETVRIELETIISNVSNQCQQGYMSLRDDLSETHKQMQENVGNFSQEFDAVRNETSNQINKNADEIRTRHHRDVLQLRDDCRQGLDGLKQEFQQIRNSTLEHIETTIQNIETDYKDGISNVINRTYTMYARLENEIISAKNVVQHEVLFLHGWAKKEHSNIINMIDNKTAESCNSSSSQVRVDLINKIDAIEKKDEEVAKKIESELNNLTFMIDALDDKYKNITDDLSTNVSMKSECTCTGTATPAPPSAFAWPEGSFGLLAPQAGCPGSASDVWQEGWIQFHTASDNNQDLVSPGSHLKKPIFRAIGYDNFIQLHYCISKANASNAKAPKWPAGSYCVNRVQGQCPGGFVSSYVQYDGEHSHVQHQSENPPDVDSPSGSLDRIHYCCRKDGREDSAIYLPSTAPFYLYRAHGAACQQVSDMKVSVEIVQIDTSHEDNEDRIENPDNRPDVGLHPVKHSLCYYTPVCDDSSDGQ